MSEREEIRVGIERKDTDEEIGQHLGRHRCTISAEINRNGGRDSYTVAQARAEAMRRRPRPCRLVADPVLAAVVTERLEAKDSPMTIARELAAGTHGMTASISHESIYQAVHAQGERGLRRRLHEGLHRRRRRRKHRTRHTAPASATGPLGTFNPISARPSIAGERVEVGHLEGDLILGSPNRSAIVTMFDRASRYLWLADLPAGHNADAVLAALVETLERIPLPLRRTLTWDQGSEMARHTDMAHLTGITVYFADPHSPWQRPTNENGNGLIRRYVAKGTNLSIHTPADLRATETRINTMPRRSIHWATAQDLYHAAVAMTG